MSESSSSPLSSRLSSIDALPAASKTAEFGSLLDELLSSSSSPPTPSDLNTYLNAALADSVGLVVSKQVVANFVKRLAADVKDVEVRKEVAERALEGLSGRSASFEEQIMQLRELLADILENEEEWSEAAKMLQAIQLEGSSSTRSVPTDYALRTYVRIVRLLLEDGDTVSASSYLSRAQNLKHTTTDQTTLLGFNLSQARIYDSQRKFLDASLKYHELSYVPEIDPEERLQMLSAAVTCAILSAAGPRRSRLLGSLYRDERSSELAQYGILQAMFLDRIIKPSQVEEFAGMLEEHQKAKLGKGAMGGLVQIEGEDGQSEEEEEEDDDELAGILLGKAAGGDETMQGASSTKGKTGSTSTQRKKFPTDVLDKAVMEHNLLSCSLLYSAITFSGLGRLLNLTSSSAEAMCRTMIIQNRLSKGTSIDQVSRTIFFERLDESKNEKGSSNVAAAAAAAALTGGLEEEEEIGVQGLAPETANWDGRIRKLAQGTEELASRCAGLMEAKTVAV